VKITILGSGTSQGIPVIGCHCDVCKSTDPRDTRTRVSALIENNDKSILIDIGPDFRTQMLTNQKENVDAVLITHEHNDHTAGLDDIRPINFQQKKDMPLFALPRVLYQLEKRFSYAFAGNRYPGAPRIELIPIHEQAFDIVGMQVHPIQVNHGSLPILGFRIENVAYLTDVRQIPESQFELLRNLDVLILSALRPKPHHSHLSLEEAIELSKRIGAQRTLLTHVSHRMGLYKEWSQVLPKGVYAAYDGMQIEC